MEQITLLARNETGEPFKVAFTKDEGRITVTCTCPEGLYGEFCEHKFRLASNDLMMLQHPGQNSEMLNAHMWIIETPLADKLLKLLELIGSDEQDEDAISAVRADIGKAMREGTPISGV